MYLHTGRIAQAAADPLADEFTSCMEVLMFPSKKVEKVKCKDYETDWNRYQESAKQNNMRKGKNEVWIRGCE